MKTLYIQQNHGKLNPSAFSLLPLGAVRATGWLKEQLVMLEQGLTGEMERFPDYMPETSEWLGGKGENWERGPYYFRGLVALAWTLDSKPLKEKAYRWIDSILSGQREGGMFGPTSNEDWWSRMPVLMALCDYYEATEREEKPDERIIPFMEAYFRCQMKCLPDRPLESWARARGGDNIYSVYWLYNKLYDSASPEDTDWLLSLSDLLASQTQDWTSIMQNTTVREHVVNTSQAMKTPPLRWQQTGSEADRTALAKGLMHISIDHGRIDDLPNSDEAARDNRSDRGSELCGIVEGMLSTEIALRIFGDRSLGDRLELLAYNALPSGYSYDYLGHVYYILQNQVMASNGYHGFDCDHGDSSAFGAPCGFDCCFSNHHMGWPKFLQSMWMATPDGGLAAVTYGPNTVETTVRGGKIARFEMKTGYPFRETVTIVYHGEDAEFPLMLRIPGWSVRTELSLDGENVTVSGDYHTLSRLWREGDTLTLTFESKVEIEDCYARSAGVKKGALIYCYPIAEAWEELADNTCRELKVEAMGKTSNREVLPAGEWNIGIDLKKSSFALETGPIPSHPFTPQTAPNRLAAMGAPIDDWRLCGNVAQTQPIGAKSDDLTSLTLIPYGCSRLKLSNIPRLNESPAALEYQAKRAGERSLFAPIVPPDVASYRLIIEGTPNSRASLWVNDRPAGELTFDRNGILICDKPEALTEDKAFRFSSELRNIVEVLGGSAHRLTLECTGVNEDTLIPHKAELPSRINYSALARMSVQPSTAYDTVRLRFERVEGARRYMIVWGDRSGDYTESLSDVIFNPYKGSHPFEADITAISAGGRNKLWLRMLALDEDRVVAASDEFEITLRE